MDKKLKSKFERLLSRADSILKDKNRLAKVLSESQAKAKANPNFTSDFQQEISALIRLLKSSIQGSYKVPWKALTYALAGLLYFLNPMDLLPDFIIGAGFFDDIAVLGFVFKTIQTDIQNFLEWERTGKTASNDKSE